MKRNPRIGILGGTFNPIHTGHLLIAQDAMEQLALDRVKFIPSSTPPHKPLDGGVTATRRLHMVKLAIRGCDEFETDDIEIRRGGTSYSVETLEELKRRNPKTDFYFIIGTDSLQELPLWRDIRRLAQLCTFAVIMRPGFSQEVPASLGVRCRFVTGHLCEISSRDIRARLARGLSVRWLVPEAVLRYIRRVKLYKGKGTLPSKHVR